MIPDYFSHGTPGRTPQTQGKEKRLQCWRQGIRSRLEKWTGIMIHKQKRAFQTNTLNAWVKTQEQEKVERLQRPVHGLIWLKYRVFRRNSSGERGLERYAKKQPREPEARLLGFMPLVSLPQNFLLFFFNIRDKKIKKKQPPSQVCTLIIFWV